MSAKIANSKLNYLKNHRRALADAGINKCNSSGECRIFRAGRRIKVNNLYMLIILLPDY
jgi:hypothetical protein